MEYKIYGFGVWLVGFFTDFWGLILVRFACSASNYGFIGGYINSLVEFNTGVYYFKKGDYKKAADQFELIGKTGKYNKYDSVKYLIEIYKRIDATSAQLETLEDLVDELDSEALDFNFEDLEKKYDL